MNPVWHFVDGVLQNGVVPIAFGPLTVSATAVTSTVPVLAPDGSAAAPSYSFASDPDTGIYWASSGDIGVTANGNGIVRFYGGTTSSVLRLAKDTAVIELGVSQDVSLSRGAANVLTLAANDAFQLAPTAFASLPTGVEGALACITDSNTATWGATIAGGGANNVIGFFNGTNWTVMGA